MSNTYNEMILTLLSNNKEEGFNGTYIRHWLYHHSIGGVKLTELALRDIIKHLRFGGHPIIAGPKGYMLTNDKTKLNEYIVSRKLELESELNILRKMEGKG